MSLRKLGGSGRYEDMGPGSPGGVTRYSVGGRSVHAADVSSGLSKGTVRDMRPHSKRDNSNTSGRSQPFVIKRRLPPLENVG
jgi:hypothetical protein